MDVPYLMTWILVMFLFCMGACFAFITGIFLCTFIRKIKTWKRKEKRKGVKWYQAEDGMMIAWPVLIVFGTVFTVGLIYAAFMIRRSII